MFPGVYPIAAATPPPLFDLGAHYDVMEQLDQDVHDNAELSRWEATTALQLVGPTPASVFLPCFGTGRHVRPLLEMGVARIVGVDLSPKCVAKAHRLVGEDSRVSLTLGDLLRFSAPERCEAAVLLGNSFADCTDLRLLERLTAAMVAPLKKGGTFIMDYVGETYLGRCYSGKTSQWDAVLDGEPVYDRRTPRFDPNTRVMTIDVEVVSKNGEPRWRGQYQKLIVRDGELVSLFDRLGLDLTCAGPAYAVNRYVTEHPEVALGMIGAANWWVGKKR